MGLILDSSVVISAERRGDTITELIRQITLKTRDDLTALSSVGLTELVHAVHRAPTEAHRQRHQTYLDEILAAFEIHPYSLETALLAGRINAEQQTKGFTVPFADLLIGCTALSLGFSVLTTNLRHFRLIPGLSVIPF